MICSKHLHELQWSWDGSRRSIEAFKSPVTTCAHYIVSFVSIGGGASCSTDLGNLCTLFGAGVASVEAHVRAKLWQTYDAMSARRNRNSTQTTAPALFYLLPLTPVKHRCNAGVVRLQPCLHQPYTTWESLTL